MFPQISTKKTSRGWCGIERFWFLCQQHVKWWFAFVTWKNDTAGRAFHTKLGRADVTDFCREKNASCSTWIFELIPLDLTFIIMMLLKQKRHLMFGFYSAIQTWCLSMANEVASCAPFFTILRLCRNVDCGLPPFRLNTKKCRGHWPTLRQV